MALGKFKQALKDFEAVVKVRPRDKDAQAKYTECNKVVRQVAFEKAIAVESSRKKPSQTIDPDAMGEGCLSIQKYLFLYHRLEDSISCSFHRFHDKQIPSLS